jgi:hypothetical protein
MNDGNGRKRRNRGRRIMGKERVKKERKERFFRDRKIRREMKRNGENVREDGRGKGGKSMNRSQKR